jgi:hypothetical protein
VGALVRGAEGGGRFLKRYYEKAAFSINDEERERDSGDDAVDSLGDVINSYWELKKEVRVRVRVGIKK